MRSAEKASLHELLTQLSKGAKLLGHTEKLAFALRIKVYHSANFRELITALIGAAAHSIGSIITNATKT